MSICTNFGAPKKNSIRLQIYKPVLPSELQKKTSQVSSTCYLQNFEQPKRKLKLHFPNTQTIETKNVSFFQSSYKK